MAVRTPIQIPLPCYGTELNEASDRCRQCVHRDPCQAAMGTWHNRVSLDRAVFKLAPPALRAVEISQADIFRQTYEECFRIVFGRQNTPDQGWRRPELQQLVLSAVEKEGCSLRLFFLTNMVGHKKANPMTPYYASMLSGNAGINRLRAYRADVQREYATFDEVSLDAYFDIDAASQLAEQQLTRSEQLVGEWVVGYKQRTAGKVAEALFQVCENQIAPLWLALSPEYAEWLLQWKQAGGKATPALESFRYKVVKLKSQLVRSKKQSSYLFQTWESIMPVVIRSVVTNLGFEPRHFRTKSEPWQSTVLFWSRLGLATQHYYCRAYLAGMKAYAEKHLKSVRNLHLK